MNISPPVHSGFWAFLPGPKLAVIPTKARWASRVLEAPESQTRCNGVRGSSSAVPQVPHSYSNGLLPCQRNLQIGDRRVPGPTSGWESWWERLGGSKNPTSE